MFNHILSCIYFDDEPTNFLEFLICFLFPLWVIPLTFIFSVYDIFKNNINFWR